MKLTSLVIAAVVLIAVPASADQSTPDQERLLKRGSKKIVVGVVLAGVGAIATPLTGMNESNARRGASAALIVGGAGLTLWGVRDRVNATRPQLTFGATLGQSKAVYFRKRW
jgi:hypothetical protein